MAVLDLSARRVRIGVAVTSGVPAAQRDALYEWLKQLRTLATQGDAPSRAMLADTELVRLVDAMRAVLGEHEPNDDGLCPSCSARAQRRGYRCAVWATVHNHLLAIDPSAPDAPRGRHALSSRGRGLVPW
jgi:hypothetical protein